ncbi:MAG: VacJ family lipoprotein [Azoarcus sp.]|nr:VacJ family lipoprotein [Azoarcus sp.]
MTDNPKSRVVLLLLACAVLLVSGCASRPHNPDDPLEGYNRAMFSFNEGVDKAVLRPAAQAYEAVTPELVRTGVGNVFSNIGDVWVGVNNLLQGKVGDGMSDLMRFGINTVFGILGIFDVATEAGLPKHDEDLGQTLAVWGVGDGPYVVLPLLGPRTARDAVATPVDMKGGALIPIDHVRTRNSLIALRVVHGRSMLLGTDRTLEEQIDKYAFVRDAYLQQRRFKVHDGDPPLEYEDFNDAPSSRGTIYRTLPDAVAFASVSGIEFVEPFAVERERFEPMAGELR